MSEPLKVDRRELRGAAAESVVVGSSGPLEFLRRTDPAPVVVTPDVAESASTAASEIQSFIVNVPESDLESLRRRINDTRWPERAQVDDASQGVQLETMQKLARYWATDYTWKRCEARLNAHPQFVTEIDGLDIHFIRVRSRHANALPIIVTHGWPGSIVEQLKIIEPLTNPTAHGGTASDAFHVVIPSLPGYGFSGKPTATGWDPPRIARAWTTLMQRLGYTRFVAQGGNAVTEQMALLTPPGLLGIHTNISATVPAEVSTVMSANQTSANEMAHRPQALYGIIDSPIGLASWMIDHDAASQALVARVFDGDCECLTRDDILDNITLYWLTNTGLSSARLYPPKGGHLAAWEQPELFVAEMRASFKTLRPS